MSQVEKRVAKDGDKVKHIIIGLVAGIIISWLLLEYYGYLRHSNCPLYTSPSPRN